MASGPQEGNVLAGLWVPSSSPSHSHTPIHTTPALPTPLLPLQLTAVGIGLNWNAPASDPATLMTPYAPQSIAFGARWAWLGELS